MAARRPLLMVVATHPIQYQVPWFRSLAEHAAMAIRVVYLRVPDVPVDDPGFQHRFGWDIPLLSGYDWVCRNSLSGFLAELRSSIPDAVLVLGWNDVGLLRAWLMAWLLGFPLLVRGDSNARRQRPWWVRWCHRLLLSVPSRFLVVGRSNSEFYLRAGVPPTKLIDAPHFVDNRFFAERGSASVRTVARARWGIDEDVFCVLFAGKFERKKRPLDLLAAVERLPRDLRAKVRVLVVGSGLLELELKSFAERHGLPVIWAGFLNQTEIPSAYAAADVLVLPSDHGETWGLVVNEAMACGLPAIVSDQVGCADDLVRHEETGLVFPMGDTDQLSMAIASLALDPLRCREMGKAACALVSRGYTIERSVEVVERAVIELSEARIRRVPAPREMDDPGEPR